MESILCHIARPTNPSGWERNVKRGRMASTMCQPLVDASMQRAKPSEAEAKQFA